MRGGWVHNTLYAGRLARELAAAGWSVATEHPVGRASSCVDLLVQRGGVRLVVEVELTPARVPGDVAKARALGAGRLWIVVPSAAVARRVQRPVGTARRAGMEIEVMTFPRALRAIKELSAWISRTNPL